MKLLRKEIVLEAIKIPDEIPVSTVIGIIAGFALIKTMSRLVQRRAIRRYLNSR